MKRLFAILLLICATYAMAQEKPVFLYDVDFVVDFDNDESNSRFQPSSTLFGMRLTPTVGVGYADSIVGSHRFMAGVSYIQPFGSTWRDARVLPIVYYQYSQRGFRANFGFVPYSMLMEELPDYLMSDKQRFLYPNIQGVLLQYSDLRGYADLFCDWRGMMSDTVREAFRVVVNGRGYLYRSSQHCISLGANAMLNHLSHSEQILGVCDDITFNPSFGYHYTSQRTPCTIRSIGGSISAGYLLSWQRDRVAEYSSVTHGLMLDATLRWWFMGVREQLYVGGNAMSLYPKYGTLLNQGDPHYQSPIYSRTEVYLTLARWQFLTLYAGWNFLYTKGEPLSHEQQITCHFSLEELMSYIHK